MMGLFERRKKGRTWTVVVGEGACLGTQNGGDEGGGEEGGGFLLRLWRGICTHVSPSVCR